MITTIILAYVIITLIDIWYKYSMNINIWFRKKDLALLVCFIPVINVLLLILILIACVVSIFHKKD